MSLRDPSVPAGHKVPGDSVLLLREGQQQWGGVRARLPGGAGQNPFALLHGSIFPPGHFLLLPGDVQRQHHQEFADVAASDRFGVTALI